MGVLRLDSSQKAVRRLFQSWRISRVVIILDRRTYLIDIVETHSNLFIIKVIKRIPSFTILDTE